MSKFVIISDKTSVARQNAVTQHLSSRRYGFWHYFPFSWLVVDRADKLTKEGLAKEIEKVAPELSFIVLGLDDVPEWLAAVSNEAGNWLDENFRD